MRGSVKAERSFSDSVLIRQGEAMKKHCFLYSCLQFCLLLTVLNAGSANAYCQALLTSEAIALNAQKTAQATATSGWCYAAVCKALLPLGVSLSGASAYQAEALLAKDRRFVAVPIYEIEDLRRGDIIVYGRSPKHPDGHICVYLGANKEASDHIAALTPARDYGATSVFRLRNEAETFPPLAPSFAWLPASMPLTSASMPLTPASAYFAPATPALVQAAPPKKVQQAKPGKSKSILARRLARTVLTQLLRRL